MKKRIMILVTEAISGGVERLIYDQMNFYNKEYIDLHVVTIRKGYLDKQFSSTSAHYTCLGATGTLRYSTYKRLINYVKMNKIDIIHTHLYLPDLYGFLIKVSIPEIKLITTKHNTNDFRKKFFWGYLDKILSLPAKQIIAVSKSVKTFISHYEYIPSRKIKVIYHGINTSRFDKKIDVSEIRAKLNIDKKNFVIGIAGRITEQKGHKYLLKAISMLKHRIANIKLIIIGVGELQDELKKIGQDLGISSNIVFLGFRENLAELYSIMNVFCLPSIYEGLGLVLVEAMFCETLVVGSNVHGITEIIDDGINGFLIPPGDSVALANVLTRIYNNDYDRGKMIEQGKVTASRFNFKKNLKKIENIYMNS
jgi:glycosyltransferase involved in cell wall biosynthesis